MNVDLTLFDTDNSYDDDPYECNDKFQDFNIIKKCKYLQRICNALEYYDSLAVAYKKTSNDIFTRFCLEHYHDLLDDIYHLQKEHGNQLQYIKNELLNEFKLRNCNIEQCLFSNRHYDMRVNDKTKKVYNDSQNSFYQQIMDTLHFNLFHLYDVGLRYESKNIQEEKYSREDKEDEINCVDKIFGTMVNQIYINRDKYDGRFTRMNRTNNIYSKYSINIGFVSTDNNYTENDQKYVDHTIITTDIDINPREPTWRDIMFQHMLKNKRIDKHQINNIYAFTVDEHYDSEALMQDIQHCNHESNIYHLVLDLKIMSCLKKYIHYSQLSQSSFSTGLIFWYWPFYHPMKVQKRDRNNKEWRDNFNDYSGYKLSDLYIDKPKYNNLKEEIINSGHCSMQEFDDKIALKSEKYIDTISARKTKALTRSRWDGITTYDLTYSTRLQYGIKSGSSISIYNLQSVICYCDMTKLCTSFGSTFRPIYFGETLYSIKQRNRNYYWLSKTLRETVEYFGTTGLDKQDNVRIVTSIDSHEHGPFYCGMSSIMVIPSFNIRLCGPSSTSKRKEIAINFAKRGGIILQLNNNGDRRDRNNLHFFDCSWLSNYSEEDERLFFGGFWKIRLESVRVIQSMQNFKRFFKSLFYFESMIDGSSIRPAMCKKLYYDPPELTRQDNIILNDLINIELKQTKNKHFDEYILKTFHLFCEKKNMLVLDLAELDNNFNSISSLIMYPIQKDPEWYYYLYGTDKRHKDCNLFRPFIFKLFPNLKEIVIITNDRTGQIDYSFSFKSFKRLYRFIGEYKRSTIIKIKAYHPVFSVSRSWIYNNWNTILSELNDTEFEISRKVLKHPRTTLEECDDNTFYENRRSDCLILIKHKRRMSTIARNTSIDHILAHTYVHFHALY